MGYRGIIRHFDKCGRLVIPMEIRRELGMENGNCKVQIIQFDDEIRIKKVKEKSND